MSQKSLGILSLLGCLLLSSPSCGTKEINPDEAIAEIVAERIASFRTNFEQDCADKVLQAAKQRADSLILDRARRMRLLADRPPKPLRPGELAPKVLQGSLPLRPLFPFEIRFDTLLRDSLYRDSIRADSLGINWPPIDSSLNDRQNE